MAKILLVEDDLELGTMISACLSYDHYTVEFIGDGQQAVVLLKASSYDLIILDWGLPGMSGIELCQGFRAVGGTTPILMLTARREIEERERGLDSGADDYLTKPFDMKELSARIRALLRRSGGRLAQNDLSFGEIVLQPTHFTAKYKDADLGLVAKEFALLELLMRHPGRVFDADEIISRVWTNDEVSSHESVRQHIKNIRRKLDAAGCPSVIQTIRGVGYKLDEAAV